MTIYMNSISFFTLSNRTHIKMAANKKAFDMQIKLLMIGDSGMWLTSLVFSSDFCIGVGKTCLLMQYASKTFIKTFITTIGFDFKIKTVNVCGKTVKLQVSNWLSRSLYRFGILLVRSVLEPLLLLTLEALRVFSSFMMWLTETLLRVFLLGWNKSLK